MCPCDNNSTVSYLDQELIVTDYYPIIEPMVTIDRKKEFSQRLNATLDHISFPPKGKDRQGQLGKLFGVNQKAARKWLEEEGFPAQKRHQDLIEKLNASGAQINAEWLFYGDQTKAPVWYKHLMNLGDVEKAEYTAQHNAVAGPDIKGKIPLINYVQAGNWVEIMESQEPMEWIERTIEVSPKAFALRVVGDSMTNPFGAPSLPEGFIAIVEPEAQYVNGSIVVARLENSNEAMIKQLVIDGPNRYLKPLNPNYRAIQINENCVICGVVKRAQFDL
jgi:SOS-response transcriptional repressor LexA